MGATTVHHPTAGQSPERLAIVMKGYPRLSETFIAQELLGLQRLGLDFTIYALREPTDTRRHPVHAAITAPVRYLPEYLYQAPLRLARSWTRIKRRPEWASGYRTARQAWLRDLKRDPTPNRIRRFGQALVLAAELPETVERLYVHFLHTPASVTRYAAMIRSLPWATSAHAKDIYTLRDWEKAEKIADMQWLVTCTAANVAHLKDLAGPHKSKITLLYHGLDFERFAALERAVNLRDGRDATDPVRLLSVGRAVEKKGYDILLTALSTLPSELNWHLTHIGGGTLQDQLKEQARRLGLDGRIAWRGSCTQDDVLTAYREADLFVLASKIADDGDRDGLPNVLMEAQSQGLCCLSTNVSGVPELIINGKTGVLVPPADAPALSLELDELIRDPVQRRTLGAAGAARVHGQFDHLSAVMRLAERLGARVPVTMAGPS